MIRYILTYLLLFFPFLVFCQENNTIGDFEQTPDSVDFVFSPIDTLNLEFQGIDTFSVNSPVAPVIEAPITYNAEDSIILSFDGQKVFLYNNSKVTYQKIELKAYYIEIDLEMKEVYAEGLLDSTGTLVQKPIFKDGNDEYDSEIIRYNFKTKKGITVKTITKQGEGFIHSERTKKIADNVFLITQGKYTVCDADDPHFYMYLTKGKLYNKNIITGPAWMVLEDLPLYFPILPFGFFPVTTTYSSGIIIPSYGEEMNRGFYLREGGYYWAASEYFDVAARGSIYSKGSWDGLLSTQYRKRYKFGGNFNFTYAKNKFGEKWLGNLSATNQFSVRWSHNQDPKASPGQTFSASVDFSTSGYDKYNSTTVNDYLTTRKSSSISYTKIINDKLNTSISLRHSQNSQDTTISLTMPEFTLNMSKIYPLKNKNQIGKKWYQDFSIGYTGNMRNEINAKEYELLNKSLINDWGNGIKHTIPITFPGFKISYFNFTPSISYNEKWYFKKYNYEYNPGAPPADPKLGLPKNVSAETIKGLNRVYDYSFSLGTSTNVYGNYTPLNQNSRISAIRHKMSPTISFSYRPDFGTERYGYYQPVQIDSIGTIKYFDINQGGIYGPSPGRGASGSINFALGNSVEMKVLDAPKGTKKNSGQIQSGDEDTETNSKATEEKYNKVKVIDDISFNTSYDLIRETFKLSNINISARTTIKGVSVNARGTLDPYVWEDGVRVNKYAFKENRGLAKLGNLSNAGLSFGMQFRSKQGRKEADSNKELFEGEDKILPGNYDDYIDFNIPWDFGFDYSFNYSRPNPTKKSTITQTLGLRGSMSLTDKLRISTSTSFDIMARDFAVTTFNITRDLHCWQMSFNFVPFGFRKSYSFVLNAKSSILKDLKIDKRSSHFDHIF